MASSVRGITMLGVEEQPDGPVPLAETEASTLLPAAPAESRSRSTRALFALLAGLVLCGTVMCWYHVANPLQQLRDTHDIDGADTGLWTVFGFNIPIGEPATTTSTNTTTSTVTRTTTPTTTETTTTETTTTATSTTTTSTSTTPITSTATTTNTQLEELLKENSAPLCKEPADSANVRTMYMYRSQSDVEYPMENVNTADLAGALWYLHHEVVVLCPRKYEITRLMRLKVTIYRTPQMQNTQWFYGGFLAFDDAACGATCNKLLDPVGGSVGCQTGDYAGIRRQWYSLPGACPFKKIPFKDAGCVAAFPGGRCGCDQRLGQGACLYHVEHAGEIRLDHLVGIQNQTEFCAAGGKEFVATADRGFGGVSFWDGFNDKAKTLARMEAVKKAFREKYPEMPEELGSNLCNA